MRAGFILVVAGILALFALSASAQTADPPALCNTWRTQWGDISAGNDAAPMRAFLGRVPATCRNLRGQIERFITQRFPPTVTPPPATTTSPTTTTRRDRQEFDDCSGAGWCPRMVVIPAGSFTMGSPESERGRGSDEGPQRRVSIRQFAVSKFEVTFDQWAACVNRGGCTGNASPGDQGWGRGTRPVINVSWNDAREYVQWLSRETGRSYRLLSEAEWEYAARGGTTTPWSWGNDPNNACTFANLVSPSEVSASTAICNDGSGQRTTPVGQYQPNPFGLFDMHGNVREWNQDCYAVSYSGLPTDGSAYDPSACSARLSRGGSWYSNPEALRSASRNRVTPTFRYRNLGLRVARTLS